ncbi:MAG: hypothetical protein H0X37_06730 [Herpetosiphonaceae bacterium]|nr:hypothetical protein [Herpetosiphonaceae bacterium]
MTLQLPLASLLLPLLGIVIVLLANGRVTVRQLTWMNMLLLLLAAGAALLPRWGWPLRTPSVDWLGIGLRSSDLAMEWSAGRDLMMVVVLLLGAGGIAAYGLPVAAGAKSGTLSVLGLLFVVTGSCVTIGAVNGLVAVAGVGMAGLGGLLIELSSVPSDRGTTVGGIMPLVAGSLTLAAATMWDATLLTTTPVWALGCLLLLCSGPLRIGRGRVPALLQTLALVLGLPTLGGWLLVHSMTTTPGIWSPTAFVACSLGGILLLVGGAVWAVTATRLSQIVAGQWTAQLGLVGLALGGRGPALALLIHATWSTVLLGWAVSALEQAAGTAQIADLPPFTTPLRRVALIYGVAAASVAGAPLLAGYLLHAQLLARLPGALVAVVFAAHALLALALIPPLAACIRRPAYAGVQHNSEPGSMPALLGALVLVLGSVWDIVQLLLLEPGRIVPQTIIAGGLRICSALLLLALANRRLRQTEAPPVFAGGEPLDKEPGWALPWSGLRAVLAPNVLDAFQAVLHSSEQVLTRMATTAQPLTRLLARRYYLSLVLAVVIVVLLAVASGSGP